jgi:ATP-binding cassette, subfamily B, bacterial PglK
LNLKNNIAIKFFRIIGFEKKKNLFIIFCFLSFIGFLETLSISVVFPLFAILVDESYLIGNTFFQNIFNFFFDNQIDFNEKLVSETKFKILTIFCIGIFILFIVKFFVSLAIFSFIENYLKRIKLKLSNLYFEGYFNFDYQSHLKLGSSKIHNNLMRIYDIPNCLNYTFLLIAELIVFLGIGLFLFYQNFLMTSIILIIFPLSTFLILKISKKRLIIWSEKKYDFALKRIRVISNLFRSIKDVKILGQTEKFISDFHKHTNDHVQTIKKEKILFYIPRLLLELVFVLTMIIVFIFTLFTFQNYSNALPQLALFAAAGFRLIPSVNRIITNYNSLKSLTYIIDLFDKDLEKFNKNKISEKQESSKKVIKDFNNNIKFENISFKYHSQSDLILDNLNFKIYKGEFVCLIGKSGSGKTTLFDLLTNLIKPTSGQIKIDDLDTKNINKNSLIKLIGYVPQNIYIAEDNLISNIAFGQIEKFYDIKKVKEVIDKINLNEFFIKNNNDFNMNVGENGAFLSGGERQRIGIGRALYNNKKILLLDESTSSVDNETERNILLDLIKLRNEITVFLIKHDERNLDLFDRVLNLKNKQIQIKND